jgi:biotin transport system substrate-specific component
MNSRASSLTVYDLIKPSSRWLELPVLLSFNLLLVASAYLAINLPFSPVPITGQTLGVLLVAMALGRTRGTAVVLAYLAEGAAGLPVFAGGKAGVAALMGPTGGYLIGFLAAAWIVGTLADKGWDRGYVKSVMAMTLGTAIIFVCGLTQLSLFVPGETLLAMGLYPFVPGAAIKIAVASVLLPSIWKFIGSKDKH